MNYIWLLVIFLVIGAIFAAITFAPKNTKIESMDEARRLITQYTSTNEYIGFDVQPEPPISEYTYEAKTKYFTLKLENGTTLNQTETTYEKVPVKEQTTISVNIQDRLLQQPLICTQGRHCDITGIIRLVDPLTGLEIKPKLYGYTITISCDFRKECTLSPTPSFTDVTYPDGTFKYTWVTNDNVLPGVYEAKIHVTSKYTNENGEEQRRIAVREIQVVE